MQQSRRLNKRQRAFLDDLFTSDLDEQAVLDKHAVSRRLYERFVEQSERQITSTHRQSRIILARYVPLAATKLVELTASDEHETASRLLAALADRSHV